MAQTDTLHLSDLHRLIKHRVALVHLARRHLRLDALQFFFAHAILDQLRDFLAQRSFDIVHRPAFAGRGFEGEQARAARGRIITGTSPAGDLLLAHQVLVEARRFVAVQHAGENLQCVRLPVLCGVLQRGRVVTHHQMRQFGGGFHHHALDTGLLGLDKHTPRRQCAPGNRAIMLLRQREHLVGLDVAGDDQRGVVRRVPAVIPRLGVADRERFQIAHPADHRMPVGMLLVNRCHHFFVQQCMRLVVGAQAALFHDDPDFPGEIGCGEIQVAHPVGFQLHRQRQFRLVQLLKIGGVVIAGKGVLAPARCRDALGKFACRHAMGALEHQVLQHMRDAGHAGALVHAACLVPDLLHHHRRAAVFLDDDFQPVRQRAFEHLRLHGSVQPCQQQRDAK